MPALLAKGSWFERNGDASLAATTYARTPSRSPRPKQTGRRHGNRSWHMREIIRTGNRAHSRIT
ncbi:MAG: hypothetical protein U5K76_07865 [Woeseiaceae bacterium]|nr:hypothetical protein [Woeseiaceae bacterium]